MPRPEAVLRHVSFGVSLKKGGKQVRKQFGPSSDGVWDGISLEGCADSVVRVAIN